MRIRKLARANSDSIYETLNYYNKDENLKLVSQQYRAWPDCKDVQAGFALYFW